METLKNKICAIALLICGGISIFIEGDATVFIFMLIIAIPMFLSKKNWID